MTPIFWCIVWVSWAASWCNFFRLSIYFMMNFHWAKRYKVNSVCPKSWTLHKMLQWTWYPIYNKFVTRNKRRVFKVFYCFIINHLYSIDFRRYVSTECSWCKKNFNFTVLLLLLLTPLKASSTSGLNFLSLAAIILTGIIKHAVFSYIATNNTGSF